VLADLGEVLAQGLVFVDASPELLLGGHVEAQLLRDDFLRISDRVPLH
jgi:hypothetical protein